MNNFINDYVVGVDVSSTSSVITILKPDGEAYGKTFSITNDLIGFNKLISILNDINSKHSKKAKIFMESTGMYHILFHNYFTNNNFECFIINPISTKNFAKQSIRKVKNDKIDSLRIAQLAQSPTFSIQNTFNENFFLLKKLCREYDSIIDHRSHFKKKLNSLLNLVFPKFDKVFSDTFSPIPLAILSKYPTYNDFLATPKSDVIKLMKSTINHSNEWAEKKYNLVLNIALEAKSLKIPTSYLGSEVCCFINIIESFSKTSDILKEQIYLLHKEMPNLEQNLKLLCTHPEVGFMSAVTLLAEIGDINNYKSAKKVVAFLGVDTSVSQSGNYNSTHNKLTKRGSRLARKTLYNLAIGSIKTRRNGAPANPILLAYYKRLTKSKPKKIAICAIMHKLINHFFAILRDQQPFELRLPEIHEKNYLSKQLTLTAI